MKRKISFHIDKSTAFYLLPTVYIMPNLVIWNDDLQAWDKNYRCISFNFGIFMFEVSIEIDYKIKKGD